MFLSAYFLYMHFKCLLCPYISNYHSEWKFGRICLINPTDGITKYKFYPWYHRLYKQLVNNIIRSHFYQLDLFYHNVYESIDQDRIFKHEKKKEIDLRLFIGFYKFKRCLKRKWNLHFFLPQTYIIKKNNTNKHFLNHYHDQLLVPKICFFIVI